MVVSSIEQNKILVTKVARCCATVMSLISLAVFYFAIHDVVRMCGDWFMETARPPLVYKAFMSTYRFVVFVLFDAFFWACGKKTPSPFGRMQVTLLSVNGVLIAAYGFIGEFGSDWINSLPRLMYTIDPVSTMYSYPGSWLLYVGFGVFLVCLAVMFHYANDLYQDLDAIV